MNKIIISLLIFLLELIVSLEAGDVITKTFPKCFEMFCLLDDYNILTGPFEGYEKTNVEIDFDILHISEIDDVRFTVTLIMHLGDNFVTCFFYKSVAFSF